MSAMQRILHTFRRRRPELTSAPTTIATQEDLYYCYRLLYNREPDEGGWAFWKKQVQQQQLTLLALTEAFLNSPEFLARREGTLYAFFLTAARQIQLVDLADFRIYARANDLYIGRALISGVPYEPHVVRRMRPFLKPATVFVDIGANIGYFSLLAAACVGATGRVLAFDPNLDNCELLKLSMQANGFTNITVYPYAVADQEQMILLAAFGSNGVVANFHADGQPGQVPRAEQQTDQEAGMANYLAKAVVLDALLHDVERIDVIKMDIEGSELRALQGMRELVARHRPAIFSEFLPTSIESQSGVPAEVYLDALRAQQYDLYVITPQDEPFGQEPKSNAEIWDYFVRFGSNHIDLVALPTS
jgi:FkbM family methyltransferase